LRHVTRRNHGRTAQLTLTLGGFLGQDMTHVGMAALYAATTQSIEALFGATLGLHLRHLLLLFYNMDPGVPQRRHLLAWMPLVLPVKGITTTVSRQSGNIGAIVASFGLTTEF
jgi:hypothetical protein